MNADSLQVHRDEARRQAEARRQDLQALQQKHSQIRALLEAKTAALAADIIGDAAADTDAAVMRLVLLEARERVYALAIEQLSARPG